MEAGVLIGFALEAGFVVGWMVRDTRVRAPDQLQQRLPEMALEVAAELSELDEGEVRAMVAAGKTLFVAGPPDVAESSDPWAAFEGRTGSVLWAVSKSDGRKLAQTRRDSAPVFDGMIAANGKLYVATMDGEVICLNGK